MDQISRRKRCEDIEIPQDGSRFRDNTDRVVCPVENRKNLSGQLITALDRLIGIGICTERNQLDAVIRLRKLLFQQLSRICLGDQDALEIEPRR